MKNERGSLGNKVVDYSLKPDPAVWNKLEDSLKQKRRRRIFFWFIFGALLLGSGGVLVNKFQQMESRPEMTGAKQASVPEPTTQTKPLNQPETLSPVGPTEKASIPKTTRETEPGFSKKAKDKNPESPEPYTTAQHLPEAKSRLKEKSKHRKFAVAMLPSVLKTKNKKSTAGKRDGLIGFTRPILKKGNQNQEASYASGEGENQPRKPESNPGKKEMDQAPEIPGNQQEAKPVRSVGEISQNQPTGNLKDVLKAENVQAPSDSVSEANLQTKDVDSTLSKAMVPPADSSVAKPKKKLRFSLMAALKVSAQRTFELNREPSGTRTIFNKDNVWNPSRLAFDLTGRADKSLSSWLGLYFQVGVGMVQDQVDVSVKPNTVTRYDLVAEGEQLNVKSIYTTDNQQIRSRFVFLISSLGFTLSPFGNSTSLRIGAGNIGSFYSMSELKSSSEAKSALTEKLGFDGNLWFLQAGITRSFSMGRRKELLFEPMVQYFTQPVFYHSEGIRGTPLYLGLQVGWKW